MRKIIESLESIWVTATFAEHGLFLNDEAPLTPEMASNNLTSEKAWSA